MLMVMIVVVEITVLSVCLSLSFTAASSSNEQKCIFCCVSCAWLCEDVRDCLIVELNVLR